MINNYDELLTFLNWCIDYIGVGFNPDTDFNYYIDVRNGSKLFSSDASESANLLLESAHDFCDINDIDIYEISLSLF